MFEPPRIKVNVGDGGEQKFEDCAIDLGVGAAQFGSPMGVHRNALGGIDKEVLQGGGGGIFAAYAKRRAAGSF